MKLLKWAAIASIGLVFKAHAFQLQDTFREPKNIMFGSAGGGSSHINWVLSILEELANRGHNITFVTHVSENFTYRDCSFIYIIVYRMINSSMEENILVFIQYL
jgi:hypothetical protein